MNTTDRHSPRLTGRAAIGASATSGLALGLTQPGGHLGPLSLVCLVPLLGAFHARRGSERLLLGGLAGAIGTAVSVGGTGSVALASYFDLGGVALGLAWLLSLLVLGALPVALFSLLVGDPTRTDSRPAFIGVGSAWVLGEAFRQALFPGAWLSLANSLTTTPELLQSASLVGPLGVSFWIAGANGLIHRAAIGPRRRPPISGLLVLVTALGSHAVWSSLADGPAGTVRVAGESGPAPGAIRVALVQSGLDSRDRDAIRSDRESRNRLVRLTRSAGPVDLVVWPESSFRSVWPFNHPLLEEAPLGISFGHLLFGAPWVESRPARDALGVAGILVDADLRLRARHQKSRLLPFAETPRLRRFPGLLAKPDMAAYSAAEDAHPLDLGIAHPGVLLCYEILFPDLARELVGDGADLLVNLSNESWLGSGTHGPDQMLAASVLRAIEERRPVLRSTTVGITAAIDAHGRIPARLPRSGEGVLVVDVVPEHAGSGFARWGHAPVGLIVFAWLVFRSIRTLARHRSRQRA